MYRTTDSIARIKEEWKNNVPSFVWQRVDPSFQLEDLTPDMIDRIGSILEMVCCPGIYSYHIINTTTLSPIFVGGAVEHTYGVRPDEFLTHSFEDLVTIYKHPDDRKAFLEFVQKAIEFSIERGIERSVKRSFYYHQQTKDGRVFQALQQGQPVFWNANGFPIALLEVIVDISHIRAADAPPMMSLLDMHDPSHPEFFTMHVTPSSPVVESLCPLTRRELEVLRLLAEGNTSKQIAWLLGTRPNTVSTQRQRILEKTKTQSTMEAVQLAMRSGWL
nr:LuxR C-terminal-related transcriptional regulator [uncultured Arsenicibacter sp.]